jgi:hypothetical protein
MGLIVEGPAFAEEEAILVVVVVIVEKYQVTK